MRVLKDLEGKQVAEYAPLLEEVIDVSSFLRYAALCYLTGNPDDMRNSGNNYYIFFNPSEGNKAYFIPYDYDWSLNINWYGGTLDNLSPIIVNMKVMVENGKVTGYFGQQLLIKIITQIEIQIMILF